MLQENGGIDKKNHKFDKNHINQEDTLALNPNKRKKNQSKENKRIEVTQIVNHLDQALNSLIVNNQSHLPKNLEEIRKRVKVESTKVLKRIKNQSLIEKIIKAKVSIAKNIQKGKTTVHLHLRNHHN